MGRLPKGFKKTLAHKHDGPEAADGDEEVQKPQAGKEKASAATASTSNEPSSGKHAPAPDLPPANGGDDGSGSDEEGSQGGPETKGRMLQRHKKEMMAFKKNLQRAGKKTKDEVAKLTAEIEERHAKELRELEAREGAGAAPVQEPNAAAVAAAAEGVSGLSVADEDGHAKGHVTKAMKRRQKHAAAEAEREARVAAEVAAAGPSARLQEEESLVALLKPMGLQMREIRADGHCLYRSLEDQLTLTSAGAEGKVMTYQELRQAAAAHIRAHPDQYAPFLDVEDGSSPQEALESYCQELESTAAWGGQLELGVLAEVLQRCIRVYAVGLPPVTLGEQYAGKAPPLQVCYLRHAFGLGEHYNSVGAAEAQAAS